MKNMKRISKVTIKRMTDDDPDTSYLGHYSDRAEGDYAIDRKHSLDCPVNAGTENGRLLTYVSGESGRIEIQMTMDQGESVSHSGQCDDDVTALAKVPAIASQLAVIDPADLAQELKGYGAWDETELADHDQNLIRFLWLAGCDIKEQSGCDCGERGDMGRGEFRYFNGCVENYKSETPEKIREYILRDYERMERLNRGDWRYIGIRAEAEILLPSGDASIVQEITSGGLWGIESDSDDAYLTPIESEQLAELREQLQAVGFSKRAISAAVKNATHENA
jgi:hypothetical protein